jgi:AcrR family transcriptional regulator
MSQALTTRQSRGTQRTKTQRAKPMPRAQRREQLLGVARRIIQQDGIGALTMSSLAEQSGASKPVVYEHFENAEAVAVALLESYFETMIEMVTARTSEAETLDEYLSIAIDAQFEFHRNNRLVVRSITNGHASGDRLNSVYLQLMDSSVETLQELVRQQGASPETSAAAGYVLCEMIANAVYEFAMHKDAETARETLKSMVIGAVHAIVPDAKARPVTPAGIIAKARAFKQSRNR